MRASRLVSILIQLQLNPRVSAARLARDLEVSKRTIYRDIDQLALAGVPVYADPGRDGGFALLEGYRTRLSGLSRDETLAAALLDAGAAAADLGLGPAARDARRKLIASLPDSALSQARHLAARIHIDPIGWYGQPGAPANLLLVKEAVLDERMIRFGYASWKGDVRRTAGPLGLVLKGGRWYLVAVCGSQVRTYRVDSITGPEKLDRPVRRPAGFDLAAHWQQSSARFEQSILAQRAAVLLTEAGVKLFEANRHTRIDPPPQPVPGRPGWLRAEVPLEDSPHGVRDVLALGPQIEVLAPASLRRAVAMAAQAILDLHAQLAAVDDSCVNR